MAPEPNRTGAGASTSGTAKDEAAAKKKIESEDLSDEDLALKQQLELYVERVQDSDPGLQKVALESMRQEIRTSTSSMTSVPKPLKFLRPHYGTLKAYYETMAESELKKYLADILSVLALTMSAEGERESLKYRLLGSEGSSSSSASSSSSDSGSDDNEDDDDMKDEDGAASDSDEEKMMVSWSPTVDVDVDFDEEDVVVGPIRSKNEIQNLPPVPPVDVTLEPHHKMVPIGVVMSTLGAQVIVEGVEKHEPLNEGSILWLTESRKPLGLVDEIFGPVKNPYYIVRYNSESEVPAGIQAGTTLVSCVPEFADRVLNNKDLYRKGYDASGANDEELSDEVEFSDDEKEAEYRKMQKMTKRGVNDQNPGKRKNNKKKFSPRDNRLPTIPNAPAAAQHVLHTVSHAPAAAPLVNHGSHSPFLGIGQGGTTTVSQFQPLNAGPNFAANGMWTNQTIFQQQPQPSQFPNAFPSNAMSYYPQNTQFSQFPVPGNPFQQQMNPSHETQFPTMMPGVQPNIFAQQPMYAPGFVGQNQMPFDSRPPFQQIQQPPIFQTQQQGFSPNELQQRPIFQAQQQGFPPAELQSERNLNLRPSSNSSNPSQFHPGSSGSRGRPTFRGAGRRGWGPAR
ncbi:H/ACA ribonucleoprotein complex non-core subunit NAF1 [Trifolium repens]|nr:H/ACA ribonucleoprotein complex non-core subunit NAF1 [Trifolium repens]